jgi:hypothetical protein
MEQQQQSETPKLIEAHSHVARIKEHVSKPVVLAIAAAVFVIAAAVVVWAMQSGPLAKLGVDVAYTEGTVEYRANANQQWQPVPKDLSLGEGAEVRTQSRGRAILNIDDGSSVRLNGESSVGFVKLVPGHIIVENKGGDVYTRVVKSDTRKFEVKTNDTTYRSLGTAYRTFNTKEQEGVEVYHSKVNILGLNSEGDVVVEQGQRYYKVSLNKPDAEGKVTELSATDVSTDSFMQWNSEEDKKEFKNELGVLFDLTPPALEVSSPANGLMTDAASVEVKGTTEAGAKVLVNGANATNNNGAFAHTVNLNVGNNGIKVEAVDGAGNKAIKNIVVGRNAPATPTPQANSFILYGTKVDGGISFTWNVSGVDVSKGFKLVKGTSPNPSYPGSDGVFLESSKRSYTLSVKDGKTYHFRICAYNGSGCSAYSNNVAVTAPLKEGSTSGEKPTGTLGLSHAGGTGFSWALNGSAPYGYKLVWATTPGPVYPGSSATFYDKGTTSGNISAGSGTYYVRICMYYEGGCKNYSNEVTITLP